MLFAIKNNPFPKISSILWSLFFPQFFIICIKSSAFEFAERD